MLSYGLLITSAAAGLQLNGSVSTGNALDTAHGDGLEATPTVLQIHVMWLIVGGNWMRLHHLSKQRSRA